MSIQNNTPPGFEDPALSFTKENYPDYFESLSENTDNEYLLSELPFINKLNTEPKEFENGSE